MGIKRSFWIHVLLIRTFKWASHYSQAISLSPQTVAICPHFPFSCTRLTFQILGRTQQLITLVWLLNKIHRLNCLVTYRSNVSSSSLHFTSVWLLCCIRMPLQQQCICCGCCGSHNALKRPQLSTIMTSGIPWKWKLFGFTHYLCTDKEQIMVNQ